MSSTSAVPLCRERVARRIRQSRVRPNSRARADRRDEAGLSFDERKNTVAAIQEFVASDEAIDNVEENQCLDIPIGQELNTRRP